jgi:hypothetical protein
MPALPFSNSMSLAPNLMDDNLTREIDLPPGPDGLLLSGGLPLAVDLDPPLDGPDVVGIFQEELLLFQLRDELGPALLDGIVLTRVTSGLACIGSPWLDETSPILIMCMTLYTARS